MYGNTRLTYAQRAQQAAANLAATLQAAGTSRLDRIGVLLEPSCELAVSLFGVSQAAGVFVPIHHGLFADQIEHIVRDCGMTALIVDTPRLAKLLPMLEQCPSLKFLVVVGSAMDTGRLASCAYPAWDAVASDPPREAAIDRDLAAILYTSGSTGKPKGVMLSHANVVAGASIVSAYLGITAAERILAVLPFSFDAGLNQLTTAIQQGGCCVMMKFCSRKRS